MAVCAICARRGQRRDPRRPVARQRREIYMSRLLQALRSRVAIAPKEAGMSTAEYCVGIVAAVAFAMVLYHAVTGGLVKHLIEGVISHVIGMIPGL